jgi:hypothetical protein
LAIRLLSGKFMVRNYGSIRLTRYRRGDNHP